MEKILERIIATDKAAREKVGEQKKRLEQINEEIAAEKELIDKASKEKADKAIAKAKAESERKSREETEKIDAHLNNARKELEKAYNENAEKWAQEIFDSVTAI